ncbi:hypothetical protein QUA56_08050 [Microcoleus sp. N3A4]|uniref:hypothetical protein n=1 Tax=Microcoleus sp. N3A4 TaxID=3055379 RepID=UPI002FD256F4
MPYFQACSLLQNPKADLVDLLDALESMSVEYGYILGMAASGCRKEPEADLMRIFLVIQSLKLRIQQKSK